MSDIIAKLFPNLNQSVSSKGWVTLSDGRHVFIGAGNSIGESLPNGLMTRSEDMPNGGSKTHAWRWANQSEINKLTSGNLKYGGQPSSETERGNWFSNAPGNFAGYGKYVIEVDRPVSSSGLGLDAPKNSVGLDNVTGIWKRSRYWDSSKSEVAFKFNKVYPRGK